MDIATELAALKRRVADLEGLEQGRGVRARVFNSANISTATGAAVAITFDSERYDTDSIHSTSSNTARLTIPYNGYYRVTGALRYASNATGFRQAQIRLNGATIIGSVVLDACATNVTDLEVTADYSFVAGDYVELVAGQTSGGNLNVSAAAALSPEFWIDKLTD